MSKHLETCDFEKRIKKIDSVCWVVGSGEMSGAVFVSTESIEFSDGCWNTDYPTIDFTYCPICGEKLINLNIKTNEKNFNFLLFSFSICFL